MNIAAPTAYVFEEFRLDLARRRLSDPSGSAVPLSGRAFDVLAYLVENRARVIGKDEILRAVWPRVVVEENNLNQAIYNVRKVLGDSREAPRFIVTVAGRGYQFIADTRIESAAAATPLEGPGVLETAATPATAAESGSLPAPELPRGAASSVEPTSQVATVPAPATQAPQQSSTAGQESQPRPGTAGPPRRTRRWLLLAGAAAAAGVAGVAWWRRGERPASGIPSSVAVLPFKPLLEPDANAAVEFGITETLINRLGTLPGVVVTPLSSVRRYAGPAVDPLQAGRKLDVAAVLDGHVQIDHDRLRLTARLIDTDNGRALWSGQFNERLDDFFDVQESLANQVVRALSVELSREQQDRLARRDTEDPEAWQLYFNGRYQWSRRTEEGFRRALESYEAAVRRDPSFALPYVGIADVLSVQGVFGMRPPSSVFPRAREAVERAIELDGGLAEAYGSLGHIQLQFHRNWQEGERLYRHSLTVRPNQPLCTFLLANCLMMQGRGEEALAEGRRSQAIEPADLTLAANLGMLLMFTRRYDLAHQQLTGLLSTAPESPLPRHHLARLQILRGEPEESIRLVEGYKAPAPGSFSNLGRAYALAGRTADARRELDRLRSLGGQGYGVGFDAALIHAALGDRESALSALEAALSDHSQMILYLNVEPGFDAVRDDPRFRAVAARLGLG